MTEGASLEGPQFKAVERFCIAGLYTENFVVTGKVEWGLLQEAVLSRGFTAREKAQIVITICLMHKSDFDFPANELRPQPSLRVQGEWLLP